MGNPPYAGHSANASLRQEMGLTGTVKNVRTFIGRLIEDYKWVDGKPLGEKNPKWLQDDYVKFLGGVNGALPKQAGVSWP